MLPCFTKAGDGANAGVVRLVTVDNFAAWKGSAAAPAAHWLDATGFKPGARKLALLPDGAGGLGSAVFVLDGKGTAVDAAALAAGLPAGERPFRVEDPDGLLDPFELHYGWASAGYRFERYRSTGKGNGGNGERTATLAVADETLALRASRLAEAVFLARDLVNTPANDLGPDELEAAVRTVGESFGAAVETIRGQALLDADYPAIHTVGRASAREPRLMDLRWGEPTAPLVTLVGKGVCFDTGGLDIKPSAGMRNMKKDMGGAAMMTGLARMIMASNLPVRLRLLVPAVENSIAGNAFRPGDVIQTRKGLSVEIGNTDAEGRLILADALAEADRERPALLIDAATLTGAARVALGTDLPALFSTDDALAADILTAGNDVAEPLWRLPLHPGYHDLLKSSVADLSSTGSKPMGGAITAALFLARFVEHTQAFAHLDIFAWNDESRPGRPRGGEATGLRALFAMLERRFGGPNARANA
jgi:leucyl aminopeptidase